MKQINAVAAMPGGAAGTITRRRMVGSRAPSIAAASRIATGTSARNECIIHTAIGRFIEVYSRTSSQMLSSMPSFWAIRYSGSSAATAGSILVDRKKNSTSVHLRTGLMASAYAAGMASSSTRIVDAMLAVAELIRAGQGLAPVDAPKNSRYPSRVSAAGNFGGVGTGVAPPWEKGRTLHATRREKPQSASPAAPS